MNSARRALSLSLGLILTPLGACADGPTRSADLGSAGFGSANSVPAPWGKSLSGNYLAGRHAERNFDLNAAADYLAAALSRDPDNITLRQRVFLLQLSGGKFGDALRHAQALAAEREGLPLTTMTLAVEAAAKGDHAKARTLIEGLEPNRYHAFMRPAGLAWLSLATDGVDTALAALEPLAAEPGFVSLYHLHRGLLNDVAGRVDVARDAFETLLERDPTPSLRMVQLVGNFYERRGERERALALYDRYRADNARIGSLLPRGTEGAAPEPLIRGARDGFAEAVFNLAGALYEDRDVALALVYARLAQVLTPGNAMIALLIGEVLEAQERFAEAAEVYAGIDPGSPFGRAAALRMAQTLDDQDDTDQAIARLQSLAAANPTDPEPLVAMGHILRARERFSEAVAAYDRAAERIGTLEPRHWSLLYARGIALERSGQWERAEADLKRALEFEPDQPYVLNYLGYSWVDRGENLAEAEKLIARAVELRPNDGFIADSLGWVYYRTGRYAEAVEQLERAVSLEPGDPVINEHLGDAYWKVGRLNEARFQWSHALRMDPEKKRLPDLQTKVQCGLGGCQAKAGGP